MTYPTIPGTDVSHLRSDVDSGVLAQHHTLGTKANQAAPGDKFLKLKRDYDALKIAHDAHKARIGKCVNFGGTATTSIPNNPANPYTSISGFTDQWGDQPQGFAYQGLGIFNCTVSGTYLVEVLFGLAANSVGRRLVFWFKNGLVDEFRRLQDNASGVSTVTCQAMTTMRLVVGDTMELRFYQDSGAALNMQQSANLVDNGQDWSRIVSITTLG